MKLPLMNYPFMPMWIIRMRNWSVDFYIAHIAPKVPEPKFSPMLCERGLLRVQERHGPEYPQCIADLARLYRRNANRINERLLCEVGRAHGEFRGIVHFTHGTCVPKYTMEFCFARSTVFVVFEDLEHVDAHEVKVLVRMHPMEPAALAELIGAIECRLEAALESTESNEAPLLGFAGAAE